MKNILKNSLFLFALCGGAACLAMEEGTLQPWVQNASKVKVQTMKTSFEIDIENGTTVLDVKKQLLRSEGIPVTQQSINAVRAKAWFPWFVAEERSPKLDDTKRVKEAMNEYNTDLFELYLSLKSNK